MFQDLTMYCSNVHYWGKQGKLGKLGGKVQGRNMLLAILAIILAVWLSGEALQIVVKRREAKSKGGKERYKHLNAEFQRIARRHKKAFLSDQCKEIEEKNRMGKTRDLFKKSRDTKGTFHAKMGSIKDRNGLDLTEAEDIKKRWQEYTEELYKKDLHDPDNHDDH